ncbi:MAG: hypothetical protein M3328_15620, partial [Chloroflexota bacterium]|nr:hypothetical protein [Chloroflexota bacterium]
MLFRVRLDLAVRLVPNAAQDHARCRLQLRVGHLDDRPGRARRAVQVRVADHAPTVEVEGYRDQRLAGLDCDEVDDEMERDATVGHDLAHRDLAPVQLGHGPRHEGAHGRAGRAFVDGRQGHVADGAVLGKEAEEPFQVDRAGDEVADGFVTREPVLLELDQCQEGGVAHFEYLPHGRAVRYYRLQKVLLDGAEVTAEPSQSDFDEGPQFNHDRARRGGSGPDRTAAAGSRASAACSA